MDQPRKTTNKIGIYILKSLLGKGGMGTVYLAHDTSLDRPVALKLLPASLAADPDYVARFEREATTLAKIRHPNLMHIYAVGRDAGHHYIAMEYIKGRTVAQLLSRRGAIALPTALRIFGQALSALDKVHAAGIVHRDLKPGNLMLDEDQRAILMDFGLAKPRDDHSVTTDNTLIGTPEYMAPELAEGQDADARSDLYALGVVLFEMLTGKVPFRASSAIATLRQHVEQPPPSPRKLAPDLPPQLDAILAKALAKKGEDRYASCRAFATDLLAVAQTPELAALAAPSSDPTAPTAPVDAAPTATAATRVPRPRRRRRSPTGALAALLLLAAIAVIALVGSLSRPRRETRSPGPSQGVVGVSPAPPSPPPPKPPEKPAPPREPVPSKGVYTVLIRNSFPIRGRLVAITGEMGYVRVETYQGELSIPYGTVVRIEPQGGK